MILILPQDVADLFVSMFSAKLEQLQMPSSKEVKEGSPGPQDGTWGKQSCLGLEFGLKSCLSLGLCLSSRLSQSLAYTS